MIKFLALRIIRSRLRSTLPSISLSNYRKLFNLSYKIFIYLKPSQLWVIVLALINKTEFKTLVSLPTMLILFNTLFLDGSSNNSKLDSKTNIQLLFSRLENNKFTDEGNNWESFFWVLILLAIIKRFTVSLFKLLWIPFKLALVYYTLKYFGFYLSYIYNILNNLSLGIIDWFHQKITNFVNLFINHTNDKNND